MQKTGLNNTKIYLVCGFFLLGFASVIFKAFQVQVIDQHDLLARSHNQIFRETRVYPRRGHIYDRNGSPLAINIQTYSIFTTPGKDDLNKSYKKLAQIVPELTYQRIIKKISNRERFTWLARKIEISKIQAQKVKELEGVYIEAVPKRLYPNHETAAQVLGFVGVDNTGLAGVEYLFDKELRGEPKVMRYIRDNKGRPIKHESTEIGTSAQDIRLTIDKGLQAVAERTLKKAVIDSDALKGGIGVLDPMTGEVLAVANYPSYDPNHPGRSQAQHRKLSFVTDPLEPGSTFKTFTIASALEHKMAKPDTNYYCEKGQLFLDGHMINEAESKRTYEWLSVEEILAYSSNIGTTKIAFDLTYPKLKATLSELGIGSKTGIEIPSESRGILTKDKNIPPLSLSNISFGQGVATTGIQMLSAYATLLNGGYYVAPTILHNEDRKIKKRKVFGQETVDQVNKMLVKAVKDGTGRNAQVENFIIAGKTSTAQRVSEKGGYEGYVPGFIGYPLNVKKPFVIYVYIDDPSGYPYYGNSLAAPVFQKVAEYILYKNKEFDHLINIPDDLAQSSGIDRVRTVQAAARLTTKGKVPNFIGLDKISAQELAEKAGIKIGHDGIGVVVEQRPNPGEDIAGDTIVRLEYNPPTYE